MEMGRKTLYGHEYASNVSMLSTLSPPQVILLPLFRLFLSYELEFTLWAPQF
jgi:hypothetical protein